MNKLSIKGSVNKSHSGKDEALNSVMRVDDYLDGPIFKARVDLDRRISKAMKELASCTEAIKNLTNNETKVFCVTGRMLMTEFILDGLDKYSDGKGKYQFQDGETFNWKR